MQSLENRPPAVDDETPQRDPSLIRSAGAFALVGFVAGLVLVLGVAPVTYAAGAACVGAAWLVVPRESLGRERPGSVVPATLLWPLAAPVVLVLTLVQLSERPAALLAGAGAACAAIAALVACVS